MHKPICIVSEPDWMPEDGLERLSEVFDIRSGPFSREELEVVAKQATGLFVGLDHILEEPLIHKGVQFIVSPTTGLNHINLKQAQDLSIKVISLKGELNFLETIVATSELCWGLILSLYRHIPNSFQSVKDGNWDRDLFKGRELKKATLGIIGLGRLGRKVANYGHAFGMNVLACDVRDVHADGVELCPLEVLLQNSDIVTLHADSHIKNYHMINARHFSIMKDAAIFINTSRGDLVDEGALLDALERKRLAGAALDVLEQEFTHEAISTPLIEYAKKNENLIITPHIGGVTQESIYRVTHFSIDKLLTWWQEEKHYNYDK